MNKMVHQSQLDLTGQRARQRFLAEYEADMNRVSTSVLVKHSLVEFVEDYFDGVPFVFITIHLTQAILRKALEIEQATHKGLLQDRFIPIGQGWYEELRSGKSDQEATETALRKLFIRVNQVLLKSQYRDHGKFLKVFAFHENDTKLYNTDPVNHVHMLCELPQATENQDYNRLKFYSQFRGLFNSLVVPIPVTKNSVALNLKAGKEHHKKYVVKQLIDWNVASDRLFYPSAPKYAAHGGTQC